MKDNFERKTESHKRDSHGRVCPYMQAQAKKPKYLNMRLLSVFTSFLGLATVATGMLLFMTSTKTAALSKELTMEKQHNVVLQKSLDKKTTKDTTQESDTSAVNDAPTDVEEK